MPDIRGITPTLLEQKLKEHKKQISKLKTEYTKCNLCNCMVMDYIVHCNGKRHQSLESRDKQGHSMKAILARLEEYRTKLEHENKSTV